MRVSVSVLVWLGVWFRGCVCVLLLPRACACVGECEWMVVCR